MGLGFGQEEGQLSLLGDRHVRVAGKVDQVEGEVMVV